MFPLKRSLIALSTVAMAACGGDTVVNPLTEFVDGSGAAITTGGTLVGSYNMTVGQSVKIQPKTTTRTNRLRWSTSNSSVATVNSQGTVSARASGSATVQVSGTGVLENYAIAVAAAPAPTVTSFSLQPKTGVSLLPGASQQFQPAATWSDGSQYPLTVTYTATGGTITGTGLFTAGSAAGRWAVVAACACGLVDTAWVDVAQLVSLTVSPKTVSVAAGATQQFGVTASWSTGATTLPPVTWSATGGTVNSNGLYTAPSTAGTYRVIVAHTNGTVRDTATVTVSGGSTGGGTTTPSAGLFFSDDFDTGRRNSANGFTWIGTDTKANPRISNEMSFNGGYAMRFEFAASPYGGQAWAEERFDMGRYLSELAFEYMIFVPANFKHRSVCETCAGTNNKFFSLWRDNYADNTGSWQISTGWLRTNDYESYALFHTTRSSHNWIAPFAQQDRFIGANTLMKPGQWNRIRFYVKAATYRGAPALTADGIMKMWINDSLFFSTNNGDFNNFDPNFVGTTLRNGYLLGYANSGFDETTVFFIDAVKFYAGNPGW